MSREIDWRTIVQRVDPDHHRKSLNVVEYQFSAPARMTESRLLASEDEEAESRAMRTFYGRFKERGAYAADPVPDLGLTWNGSAITWNGIPLTWDNE